jgi:hypothetical protein
VHEAVHLNGEPGENGKGSGTTLGMAEKCLTRLVSVPHRVPRQAARSGTNTGQEAPGGTDQLAGRSRRRWVRWDGRNRHLVGSDPRERRLRAAGTGSGSGSLKRRHGLRVEAAGRQPEHATWHQGPRALERRSGQAGSSAAVPSGSGARGSVASHLAPGPPGAGAKEQAPPVARHRSPRAAGSERRRRQDLAGSPPGGSAGAWHRSAPRSWRGKPRRLLGATTVFEAQLLRACADRRPYLAPLGPRGASSCRPPPHSAPGAPSPP